MGNLLTDDEIKLLSVVDLDTERYHQTQVLQDLRARVETLERYVRELNRELRVRLVRPLPSPAGIVPRTESR